MTSRFAALHEMTAAQKLTLSSLERMWRVSAAPHFTHELTSFGQVKLLTSTRCVLVARNGSIIYDGRRSRRA